MNGLKYTDIPADALDEGHEAEVLDEGAMIVALRRYRAAREELDVQKRRAKEYLEQVKAEVEAEVAPLEARLQELRASMHNFIEEHNGGRKFKVAGLGTVYTSRGVSITVSDEQTLMTYIEAERPGQDLERVFPRKLSIPGAKRLAQEELEESGEQIPGIEAEAGSTLNVRLSKAAAPVRSSPRSHPA